MHMPTNTSHTPRSIRARSSIYALPRYASAHAPNRTQASQVGPQRPASPLVLSSGATPSRMALSASASVRSSEMTIAAPEDQARALPARDDAGCTLQAAAACNDCFQRPLAFKFLAFFTRFLGWCGTDIDSVQEIDSLRHADPTGNATTHPHRRPIPRPTCVGRGICRVATARDLGKIWVSGFGPWEPAAASST